MTDLFCQGTRLHEQAREFLLVDISGPTDLDVPEALAGPLKPGRLQFHSLKEAQVDVVPVDHDPCDVLVVDKIGRIPPFDELLGLR